MRGGLHNNLNPVTVTTWVVIKLSITVFLVCNFTFYFLDDLKDKHINYKSVLPGI